MPSRRFLVVSVFWMPAILISAFPHLTTRGDCDSLLCAPSLPEIIDGVGNAWNGAGDILSAGFDAAAADIGNIGTIHTLSGWTINPATGLLEPPATEPTTPNLDDVNPNAFNPTPAPIPDNEIDTADPPLKNGQCDSASAPILDLNQGIAQLGITNFQDCEKATAQIVWPFNCENTDENANTEKILSGMDAGVLKSIDPTCAVEGGTSFWVLNLTPDQVEELKTQQKQSVKDIGANAPIEPSGHPISPDLKVSPAEKRVRYHKRDTVIKQSGLSFEPRLAFISSKKNYNAMSYAYFSPAGAGVTVYLIDTGLATLDEFRDVNINKDWIFALESDPSYSDSGFRDGSAHGTCMASLITGRRYGVSKNVELIIVKIAKSSASFLDGLGKIVEDVGKKAAENIKVEGYTVVSISWGYRATSSEQEQMEKYVKELAEKYQVVVVVSSGQDFNVETYPDVYMWPAMFSLTSDIITVGAVRATDDSDNGKRYEWSSGGNALTVSAPGGGQCGLEAGFRGTSVSSATVAGLAAYFLSLPSVGGYLRGFASVPKAMINYLDFLSYPRYGTEKAVSNGLDGDSDRTEWDNWLGVSSDNQPKA